MGLALFRRCQPILGHTPHRDVPVPLIQRPAHPWACVAPAHPCARDIPPIPGHASLRRIHAPATYRPSLGIKKPRISGAEFDLGHPGPNPHCGSRSVLAAILASFYILPPEYSFLLLPVFVFDGSTSDQGEGLFNRLWCLNNVHKAVFTHHRQVRKVDRDAETGVKMVHLIT